MSCKEKAKSRLCMAFQEFASSHKHKQINESISKWAAHGWSGQELHLDQFFQEYRYPTSREFLCGKVLEKDCNNKHEVYTCVDCRLECNSIVCVECFDKERHKGHQFEAQQVSYGFCDCGDHEKWKEESFCKRHQFLEKEEDCPLPSHSKSQLKPKAVHLIQLLCCLYNEYLKYYHQHLVLNEQTIEIEPEFKETGGYIKEAVDFLGIALMEQLIGINKNRGAINRLTREVLDSEIDVSYLKEVQVLNPQLSSMKARQALLMFDQLEKTPSKCIQLLILLFFRNSPLLEQTTIDYINRFNQSYAFASSPYRELAPQLISNSLTVSKLAKSNRMPLFCLQMSVDWGKVRRKELESKVREVCQHYGVMISDLIYLNSLTPACSLNYWEYFLAKGGFLSLASYSEVLPHPLTLKEVSSKFYEMENKFMLKFIKILNLLSLSSKTEDNPLKKLVFQMFTKIVSAPERMEEDLFFSYERMFALTAYVFLLESNKERTPFALTVYVFLFEPKEERTPFHSISDEQIKRLYLVLKFTSKEEARAKLSSLMERILRYFLKVDRLLYGEDSPKNTKDVYFNHNNILVSADSLLFKVVAKLIIYLDSLPTSKLKTSPPKAENRYKTIVELIDKQLCSISGLKASSLHPHQLSWKEQGEKVSAQAERLTIFVSRLLECIYSEFPDLIISAKMEQLKHTPAYKQLYQKYYAQLLESFPNGQAKPEQFRNVARYVLFEEDASLEAFIWNNSEHGLLRSMLEAGKINLNLFHSLKLKAQHPQIRKLLPNPSLDSFPFTVPPEGSFILQTQASPILAKWFIWIVNNYHPNKLSGSILRGLALQLWKTSLFASSSFFHIFFQLKVGTIEKRRMKQFRGFLDIQLQKKIFAVSTFFRSEEKEVGEMSEEEEEDSSNSVVIDLRKKPPLELPLTQPVCAKCKRPASFKSELYQMCFVASGTMPPIYDLQPYQPTLIFLSCQHFIHKDCVASSKGERRCVQCNQIYNLELISQETLNASNMEIMFESNLKEMLKRVESIVKGWEERMQVSIFKSILNFTLVLSALPNRRPFLQEQGRTMRTLFHLLKKHLSLKKSKSLTESIHSQNLKVKEGSPHQIFVSNITTLLAENLLPKYTQCLIPLQASSETTIILQFLRQLFSSKTMRFPIELLQAEKSQFSLLRLPQILKQLHERHKGNCSCEQGQIKGAFLICLLHHSTKRHKFCDKCYKDNLKTHIQKYHNNSAVAVKSDSGEIFYFEVEKQKLKQLPLKPVYYDRERESYSGRSRDQFWLDWELYSKVHSDYLYGRYLNAQ